LRDAKTGKIERKILQLCLGYALIVLGIGFIGFAEDIALECWAMVAIYAAGTLLSMGGLLLVAKTPIGNAGSRGRLLPRSEGNFLGRFRLNSYILEASERIGANGGKEFRLMSSPSMSAEREAACIRYLVIDGLIWELWPRFIQKIEEETDWAFLV
jgi:hypothetical protein